MSRWYVVIWFLLHVSRITRSHRHGRDFRHDASFDQARCLFAQTRYSPVKTIPTSTRAFPLGPGEPPSGSATRVPYAPAASMSPSPTASGFQHPASVTYVTVRSSETALQSATELDLRQRQDAHCWTFTHVIAHAPPPHGHVAAPRHVRQASSAVHVHSYWFLLSQPPLPLSVLSTSLSGLSPHLQAVLRTSSTPLAVAASTPTLPEHDGRQPRRRRAACNLPLVLRAGIE